VIERIPATIELAVAATVIALLIAVPLGVVSATRRGSPSDYSATLFSLLGISTPNFWLGLMLILLVGVWYGIPYPTITPGSSFPVGIGLIDLPTGRRGAGFGEAVMALLRDGSVDQLGLWVKHITLPAITLGTYFTALITRLTRSGMIDELGKPYVTATEAKGLPGVLVRYKHVLRNTMIPIVTVLGLQMGTLMGGAVITETVFNWPGIGLRLISALGVRDWPLMQGIILFIAIMFVVINIVVDALYTYLDPQVTIE
jgi:peptide/nickel transport system permease protein